MALGAHVLGAFAGRSGAAGGFGVHSSGMNVLCIVIEGLAVEMVGCYGYSAVKTPCLDRFAETGMRFSRCYCQAPARHLSRRSFLTGLRPAPMQDDNEADPLDHGAPEKPTSLPGLLDQYGFHTVSIGNLFPGAQTACASDG